MRTASRSCEQDGRIIALDRCPSFAPLMAMLRHRERRDDRTLATLLYSSRSVDDVIYRPELEQSPAVQTPNRRQPIAVRTSGPLARC
jgi:ferredoxin-NADP reductase